MAYDHTVHEVHTLTTVGNVVHSLLTSGDKGRWMAGYVPHIIKAVAAVGLSTIVMTTKPVISWRLATGLKATATGGQFAVMTLVSTNTRGKVFYNKGLNQEIKPGEAAVPVVTTEATLGALFRFILYVTPRWEQPGNNANMTEKLT